MIKIAESIHYEVFKEYEKVFLNIKQANKQILIGDFYGEVEKVIITSEEKYCIMAGCGVIAYSLREPYTPYEYQKVNAQWKEWYRDGDIWVVDIEFKNNKDLIIQLENGERKLVI